MSPVVDEVLGNHEWEPVAVVGDVRAHASAGVRLPPVQDVAFRELVAARFDDLRRARTRVLRTAAPASPAAGRGSRTLR